MLLSNMLTVLQFTWDIESSADGYMDSKDKTPLLRTAKQVATPSKSAVSVSITTKRAGFICLEPNPNYMCNEMVLPFSGIVNIF